MRAGARLQELRTRLGMTTREVAEKSERIAEDKGSEEFKISIAWLTEIENSDGIPSIYKLYTLSVVYHVKFSDLLLLYGVDLENIPQDRTRVRPNHTHLTSIEVYDQDRIAMFPIRFDRGFDVERTNLLSRMVEIWGEVPVNLIRHLDVRNNLYGYIGLRDFTLYPLLRPGSFVQIDQTVRTTRPTHRRSEYERPIYFVELRDSYLCSWCELQGSRLIVIPHPLSPCSVRQYEFPRDALIVGQVTGVAMRIVDAAPQPSGESPKLPKQL